MFCAAICVLIECSTDASTWGLASKYWTEHLGGLRRLLRAPNQSPADTPSSDQLARENSPTIVGIGIGNPKRNQAATDSRRNRQAEVGPYEPGRDCAAAEQRGRARYRRCDISSGYSRCPKHRECVHSAAQGPGRRRAFDAEARSQNPKYAQKRQQFGKVQLSRQIRPALALNERVGDKGQSGEPRAKKENLRDRGRDEREFGPNPVSKENLREDNARRAHRCISIS